jgi:hypothetical protein
MNTPGFLKWAGIAAGLAFVSACAGGSGVAPTVSAANAVAPNATLVHNTLFLNGKPVTAARLGTSPAFAQLAPDAAKSKSYEYVFNSYQSYGSVFNYPKSIDMISQVDGAGGQGCTNVLSGYGKKIVWNAGRTNNVMTEYSVPSNKVLRTLPINYKFTSSCAMNSDGDLAVGIILSDSYGAGGQLVIFKNAAGKPKVYNTPLYKEYFDGYDPKGNLFADGENTSYGFMLVELPKGSKKAVQMTTSNTVNFPGSVQWDGKYLAVTDQTADAVYQYTVSGTKATLKNTISLSGAGDCAQTWIVPGLIYCADAFNDNGSVYKYPAGGSPVAVFSGDFDEPLGVTAADK